MSITGSYYHSDHYYIHFRMFTYMYIAPGPSIPGQGQIIRWGPFQATKEAFTTMVICCKNQKNCFELRFYIDFYCDFIHAGERRQITPMG